MSYLYYILEIAFYESCIALLLVLILAFVFKKRPYIKYLVAVLPFLYMGALFFFPSVFFPNMESGGLAWFVVYPVVLTAQIPVIIIILGTSLIFDGIANAVKTKNSKRKNLGGSENEKEN